MSEPNPVNHQNPMKHDMSWKGCRTALDQAAVQPSLYWRINVHTTARSISDREEAHESKISRMHYQHVARLATPQALIELRRFLEMDSNKVASFGCHPRLPQRTDDLVELKSIVKPLYGILQSLFASAYIVCTAKSAGHISFHTNWSNKREVLEH